MATVQFVDSISSSPTVRLDLTAAPWRILAEGTDVSPPDLRRASMSSMLADGVRVPASAYEPRTLILALRVAESASTDAALSQVQLLARELDRRATGDAYLRGESDNILKWQPRGATNPVFFKTFRSPLGKYQDVLASRKLVTVQILAEPFAYGLRQTFSPVTVYNDPTSSTNPMGFDVTGVKGDVETPLDLSFPASSVIAAGRRTSCVAVRRGGTPSNAPFFLQAEGQTLGSNVALQSNDTTMIGAGQNYVRASSLGSSFATKLTTTSVWPATASADTRGVYRRFVRTRVSSSTAEVRIKLDQSGDGVNYIDGDQTILAAGTARRYTDAGLAQIPLGADPVTGLDGSVLAVRGCYWRLQAALTANSGTLDVDGTVFVPADDRLLFIKWPGTSGPATMVLDSDRQVVYALGSSGEEYSTEIVEMVGGAPRVSPGVTNRVTFLLDVGSTSTAGDDKTATTSITASYLPRYLQAAPLAT